MGAVEFQLSQTDHLIRVSHPIRNCAREMRISFHFSIASEFAQGAKQGLPDSARKVQRILTINGKLEQSLRRHLIIMGRAYLDRQFMTPTLISHAANWFQH